MSNPDHQPHVGAAHSIFGLLSSIAIGCNKPHSLQQSNSTDTTDQSSKTHRSQPCTHKFPSSQAAGPAHTAACQRTPVNWRGRRRRYQIRALRGRGLAGRSEASVPGGSVSGKLQHYLIVAHPLCKHDWRAQQLTLPTWSAIEIFKNVH